MRIAIGSIMRETNTFAPMPTDMEVFAAGYLWRGAELLERYAGMRVEMAGFLDALAAAGATPVPLLSAHAFSGGPVTRAAFDQLVGELTARLSEAMPLDGVLLALHGAMVIEDDPDAEGRILEAVRAVVGVDIPIAASLDLHGHITPLMIEQASILVGYREYPHIDMYETGERTAQLLLDVLCGKLRPALALAKRPMIANPVKARTTDEPLRQIVEAARAMERDGRIVAASLFPVQPWLDVPDLGFAALVLAEDVAAAQSAADELASMAWDKRAEFEPEIIELPEGRADRPGRSHRHDGGGRRRRRAQQRRRRPRGSAARAAGAGRGPRRQADLPDAARCRGRAGRRRCRHRCGGDAAGRPQALDARGPAAAGHRPRDRA